MSDIWINVQYTGLIYAIIATLFLLVAATSAYGLRLITQSTTQGNSSTPKGIKSALFIGLIASPVLLVLLAGVIIE